jgi:hypothetical protein
MLAPEFKSQLESKGHRVIYARVFVHYDGKEIHGLDSTGEPEVRPIVDCDGKPITPAVIIPASATGKFYFGDDAETVKTKIQANMPDLEKVNGNEKSDGSAVSVVRDVLDILQ